MTNKSSDQAIGAQQKEYRLMVKRVETYKKVSAHTTTALMGAASIFSIITLAYNLYYLQKQQYYVARTKANVTQEIDYE